MRNDNGRRLKLVLSRARSWLADVGGPDAFWALVAFAVATVVAAGVLNVPLTIVVVLVLMTLSAWRRRGWPR